MRVLYPQEISNIVLQTFGIYLPNPTASHSIRMLPRYSSPQIESHRGHRCLSVEWFVCWQVEVSASDCSLLQRSPTDCGASLCVIKKLRVTRRP
jgi:hypothetical protein